MIFSFLFIFGSCAPVIIWDGRFPASIPEKSCRILIKGAARDHLKAEMINSTQLHRAYNSVEKKKNSIAYPEVASLDDVSLVPLKPQKITKNFNLSPGLSSGILERIREIGGVFDDYKKVSDAKPRDLSLVEQKEIIESSREFSERITEREGLDELGKERVFLKDLAEKLYDFEKDLLSVKLKPKGAIPDPNYDFPGLGKNHKGAYDYVQSYWSSLVKKTPKTTKGSILPLPFEFPVANATRFDEMYYWDTYFGLHGLMNSGHLELSQKTVENFLYMIRNYGLIPNGNRDYYLSRSQPPFISSMVKDVYEASMKQQPERAVELKRWLKERAYPLLKKDLENFWMNPKTRFDEKTGLHHHYDEVNLARPERHSADKELADSWDDPQGLGMDYVDTRAVAESGLDFTDVLGKEAAQAANPLLNSMIYKYTKDLELMAKE
ncbi:MAG: alpha,alpha-trehalase, partial [Halobacteriovoraceae bacterium]|nr:alpha,alpha-trehalase [Halobacteriovoraceae bacterium]